MVPNWYFYNTDPVTVAVVAADIEIAGLSHAEAHDPKIGGLVVENCPSSGAPRQEITLSCVTAGWTGNLLLSRNNSKVRVFTATNGGSEIWFDGSHNIFATANLPCQPLRGRVVVQ